MSWWKGLVKLIGWGMVCLAVMGCSELIHVLTQKEIKYEVTGTSYLVSITILNAYGDSEKFSSIPLPWRDSFFVATPYSAYVSAQNKAIFGDVAVKLYVNGKEIRAVTNSGYDAISTIAETIE
ncbi:MAG: hypothetical protein FWB90_04625 [Fibromonadales bacterium]|nr:hypothetical protein [Fibromonadales bacterium]